MAQSGVKEEEALAACGVLYLVALTTNGQHRLGSPEEPGAPLF
jgi:hypothetical protein